MALDVVRVPGWERFGWLRHGFSTRGAGHSTAYGPGELNLGFTADDDADGVRRNRELFLAGVELTGESAATLKTVKQVHSGRVVRIDGNEEAVEADGMISSAVGLTLGILTADCVPVLLVDTRLRAVGALHAGWRGTAAGIAGAGVACLQAEFGSRAGDLVAAVGPSIGPCCYEVGADFHDHFTADLFRGQRLDLWEANRRQLAEAGVQEVHVVGQCTACTRGMDGGRKYFSHRDEKGKTGRMMAAIGVRRECAAREGSCDGA